MENKDHIYCDFNHKNIKTIKDITSAIELDFESCKDIEESINKQLNENCIMIEDIAKTENILENDPNIKILKDIKNKEEKEIDIEPYTISSFYKPLMQNLEDGEIQDEFMIDSFVKNNIPKYEELDYPSNPLSHSNPIFMKYMNKVQTRQKHNRAGAEMLKRSVIRGECSDDVQENYLFQNRYFDRNDWRIKRRDLKNQQREIEQNNQYRYPPQNQYTPNYSNPYGNINANPYQIAAVSNNPEMFYPRIIGYNRIQSLPNQIPTYEFPAEMFENKESIQKSVNNLSYELRPMQYPEKPMQYPEKPMQYPEKPMQYPEKPMQYPERPMQYPERAQYNTQCNRSNIKSSQFNMSLSLNHQFQL